MRAWCESLPAGAWTRLTVRDGEADPLDVEIVAQRVESKDQLSNADRGTPLEELARVAKAEHRIEECLKRGKSEAGLGDYQVRNWLGWHHHKTLSLLGAWFLVGETWRGKKGAPALTLPQARAGLALLFRKTCRCDTEARSGRERMRWLERNELARLDHYKAWNQLPPLKNGRHDPLRQ